MLLSRSARFMACCVLLAAVPVSSTAATFVKWSSVNRGVDLGEGSGIVEVSAAGDPAVAYVVVDRVGLYTSTDLGASWTLLRGDAACLASPKVVAAAPNNGQVVYTASAGSGLWRSSDGGATWARCGSDGGAMAPADIEWVTVSRTDADLLVVGHASGSSISLSADGGESWAVRDLGRDVKGQLPFIIDDQRWVVTSRLQGGIALVTEDSGMSWTPATGKADYFAGPLPVIQSGEMFFASSHHGTNKSVDGGRTWTYTMERHARVIGAMDGILFREDRESIRGEKARLLTINMSDDLANSWKDITCALIDLVPPELRSCVTIQNEVDPFAHVRMATAWSALEASRTVFLGLGKAGLYRGEFMKTAKAPLVANAAVNPIALVEGDTVTSVTLNVMASPRSGSMKRVYADLAAIGGASLQLFDDGKHGDGQANDRVYANTFKMGRRASSGNKCIGVIAEDQKGRIGSITVSFKVSSAAERMIVWDGDKFANGGGWAAPQGGFTYLKAQTDDAHGGKVALEFHADVDGGFAGGGWNWHGWYPEGSGTDIRAYRNLSFWVKIEGDEPRPFSVALNCSTHAKAEGTGTKSVNASDYVLPPSADIADGEWHEVAIPLADLYDKEDMKFNPEKAWGVNLDSWDPGPGRFSAYIDDIGFDNRPVRARSVWVTMAEARDPAPLGDDVIDVLASVDIKAEGIDINPRIYGASMGDRKAALEAGLFSMRAGGNPMTPLNWKTGFSSKGADWFYQNDGSETTPDRTWLSTFHAENKKFGIDTYLTIPMMGRVAKDGESVAFDTRKYPDQESWAGKSQPTDPRPHAGNGRQFVKGADGQILQDDQGRPVLKTIVADPNDTSVAMSVEEQTDVLRFMIDQMGYGRARDGGIKYIALDNEPFLWSSTHRGMRVKGCSYDELWERTRDYSTRYKDIDPDVKIACATFWGWTAYFYSGLDSQLVGEGKGNWDSPPDFAEHGSVPVTKWLLTKLREHERETGVRLCDILDVHFYPQTGIYMGGKANDSEVMEGRVQETRVMWDPTWKDPSWMGTETGGIIKVIRRMKEWIDECNPGMEMAIGEYNFGGDADVSGGVAQSELLGIFAREKVAYAYLWLFPYVNSPHYFAFKMFRNPDGKHTAFGDRYLPSTVKSPDDVSVHAARDEATGQLTFVLVNKRSAKGARVSISFNKDVPWQKVIPYEYSAADRFCIGQLPELLIGGDSASVDLPPMSVLRFDIRP